MSSIRRFNINEINDICVAEFTDHKIAIESDIFDIGNQMYELVDVKGYRKIILNFTNIEYFTAAALGKVIMMDKKMKSAKGKLRLCCIKPDVYEEFQITRLDKVLDIKDTLEAACLNF